MTNEIARLTRLALLTLLAGACAGGSAEAPARAPDAVLARCPMPEARPELARLVEVAPGIRQDIRYATSDNFTGAALPGYEVGEALLRPAAAASLARVQERLATRGLGLLVWDAYRPVRATLAMVEWAERTGNEWVLDEGYVARRSNHNRGNTVDLTLIDLTSGRALDMGTANDHVGPESHTANATGAVARNRALLLDAMEAEGWSNYDKEWWHYSREPAADFVDVPLACYTG